MVLFNKHLRDQNKIIQYSPLQLKIAGYTPNEIINGFNSNSTGDNGITVSNDSAKELYQADLPLIN